MTFRYKKMARTILSKRDEMEKKGLLDGSYKRPPKPKKPKKPASKLNFIIILTVTEHVRQVS